MDLKSAKKVQYIFLVENLRKTPKQNETETVLVPWFTKRVSVYTLEYIFFNNRILKSTRKLVTVVIFRNYNNI